MEPSPTYRPGHHVLADLYGCRHLDDVLAIEAILSRAASAAGATIIATHFHSFPSAGGVTGMVLLAESHISIHTWPEHGFAAVDIFMCGPAKAEAAMEVIRDALGSDRLVIKREQRGEGIT